MLFVCHWELNEATPVVERLQAAQKVLASGLFPGPKVKLIRWDATPDVWGITVFEAETAADALQFVDLWRITVPGFFRSVRVAPAMPVQEWMEQAGSLIKALVR
jgi:hypothetical protein